LQQLQAEGLDVNIPDEWQAPSPLVIEPGRNQGEVCDLGGGNTGYAIPLRIISLGRVIVTDYEISSEWDDVSIDLAYLPETQGRCHYGPLDYAANEVLNDRIERGLHFNFRGQMVEGVFIAWGCAPVPKKYRREALVPVRVVLMDSLKREVTRDLLLPGCAAKRNQTKARLWHAPDLSDLRDTTDPPGAQLRESQGDIQHRRVGADFGVGHGPTAAKVEHRE
jgi:hypothetical protein